ncbi:MAG: hypothetical protein AAGF14_01340 [Pseudomonadota bacterium]
MLDKILVLISMAALVAFLGVVLGFVAEPDLIIVTCLIVALAMHDFWISVFKPGADTSKVEDLPLEALPTGVSGKPLPGQKEPEKPKQSRKKPARKKK